MSSSILFALSSTIIFSLSSIIFGIFSKKSTPIWMNTFKASVALVGFTIAAASSGGLATLPPLPVVGFLVFSGLIGLNAGDYFLFKAFQRVGPARTLIVFSFQPLMMATFAYLVFGQRLSVQQTVAIFLMIACVLNIGFEKFRLEGKWELWGPLFAFIGVLLDCFGVLATRHAFDSDPSLGVLEANFYRCLGAGVGFFFIAHLFQVKLKRRFLRFSLRTKFIVVIASFMGTFVSLWLYLYALKDGHLGKVAAIVGMGPLFTTVFECIVQRRLPNRYLWVSLSLFAVGFYLLTGAS